MAHTATIDAIQDKLFYPLLESLCDDSVPMCPIRIPRMQSLYNEDQINDERGTIIRFDREGCKTYSQIMAIASFVVELIRADRTVSLRDVYYAFKHLFKAQSECNACILKLGRILQKKRCNKIAYSSLLFAVALIMISSIPMWLTPAVAVTVYMFYSRNAHHARHER